MREHVPCPTCHETIRFGRDIVFGRTVQSCRCGSGPLPLREAVEVKGFGPLEVPRHAPKLGGMACTVCGTPCGKRRKTCSPECLNTAVSAGVTARMRREREAGRPKRIGITLPRKSA